MENYAEFKSCEEFGDCNEVVKIIVEYLEKATRYYADSKNNLEVVICFEKAIGYYEKNKDDVKIAECLEKMAECWKKEAERHIEYKLYNKTVGESRNTIIREYYEKAAECCEKASIYYEKSQNYEKAAECCEKASIYYKESQNSEKEAECYKNVLEYCKEDIEKITNIMGKNNQYKRVGVK